MKRFLRFWKSPQRIPWMFLAPSMILLVVFVGLPLVSSLLMSLTDMSIFLNDTNFVGVDNFQRAFADNRVWGSMKNTFVFSLFSIPLQILTALIIAACISRDTRMNRLTRSVLFVPTLCSFTAIGIIFIMLCDRTIGILPYWITQLGFPKPDMLTKGPSAMLWVIVISVWRNFGTSMVILIAGIQGISPSLYDAAAIDGAGSLQTFVHITVPQLFSNIGFCALTVTINCLQMFDQSYIITKGGPLFQTESVVQYVYTVAFKNYNLGYASSIAVILFACIMAIVLVMNRFITRTEKELY